MNWRRRCSAKTRSKPIVFAFLDEASRFFPLQSETRVVELGLVRAYVGQLSDADQGTASVGPATVSQLQSFQRFGDP
nr:hypothetical protein BaRGS_003537 [Batillaria attramentaria]